MGPTVHLGDHPSVDVTDQVVDPRPPDRIEFATEGVIRMTASLLGEFEGSTLNPVRVGIAVGPSRTVEIDLDEEASLRLASVDVGVETPDADDLSNAMDAFSSSGDDGADSSGASRGAIAFTVEGSIRDLSEETLRTIADESPTLESITFSVGESVESDGGSPSEVLLEVSLFGYGIVVRRNGTIEVGANGAATDVGLL